MTEENVIHIPVHLYSQYDIKSKGVKCDNLYLNYLYLLPRLVVLAVGKVYNHSFHIKALFKQSCRTYLTFSIPLKFQQTHPDTSIPPRHKWWYWWDLAEGKIKDLGVHSFMVKTLCSSWKSWFGMTTMHARWNQLISNYLLKYSDTLQTHYRHIHCQNTPI